MKFSSYLNPIFITLILSTLLFAACAPAAPSAPAPDPETAKPAEAANVEDAPASREAVEVKVVTLPFITFAPYYIALEEGFFAEQGLEIELVNMTRQEEILPALASGQVDVSSGLLSAAMLNTIARGGNIMITSDKGFIEAEGCINYAVIGRRDLVEAGELETAAQLKGRVVNIVPATWLEFYTAKVLETGGLSLNDIEKVNLSAPASPEAFDQKKIAAAVNSEPWVTRFKEAGHVPVLALPQELQPNATAAVMVYGPTLLGENIDTGTRFMVAYLKAVRQYQQGKTDRNIEIVAKFTQLEPDLLKEMCWPAIQTSGEVNIESVLDFQQWAISAGYQETALTAEQIYDPRFVENANKLLDTAQ